MVDENAAGGMPPQNADAERAVLGAMLLDSVCIPEVSEVLRPEDFYVPSHEIIYQAILDLYEATQPVDFITISERLNRAELLEQVGGRDYVVLLGQSMTGAGRAVHHAKLVRDASRLRGLMQECLCLSAEAQHFTGETVDGFLDQAESRIYDVVREAERRDAVDMATIMKQEMHRIQNLSDPALQRGGLRGGFRELDELTYGFQPGDLLILAARPSMGKTAFALNVVEHIACTGQGGVAFFSLEMSVEQVGRRLLCSRAKVDAHLLRTGKLPNSERHKLGAAAGELHDAPIFVDDTPGISVLALRSKARRLAAKNNIKLVVVDYLQLMDAPRAESRQQEIAVISRSLKALARELEVPVLALSQLNRAVDARDDKRPRMSDLRESGAIEQDADVIMLLFRGEYYKPTEANQGLAEIEIAKQRNGPTGRVKLQWTARHMRFENLAIPADGVSS